MIAIAQAETEEQLAAARAIFIEYEEWLGVSLCFQGFDKEIADLPGKYAPPKGRLLLATDDDAVAGCVGLRDLGEGISEIKRLFVRESFQGSGLGKLLLKTIIAEARTAGYSKIRLDSWIPRMGRAIDMYTAHGFYVIKPYNENPYEMIFMELSL